MLAATPGASSEGPMATLPSLRALVQGTFCWDLPPAPPRGDSVAIMSVFRWGTPFVLAAVAQWGPEGAVEWHVHGVVDDVGGSGPGGGLGRGGFSIREAVLSKHGWQWRHWARRGEVDLETDLMRLGPAFEGMPMAYQGDWKRFERNAAGSLYLRDLDHLEVRPAGRGSLGGIECDVYKVTPRRPVKVEEPHTVHQYRVWIDPARELQVGADGLDKDGNLVRRLRCSDFVQRADGQWVALSVTTVADPGTRRSSKHWKARGGGGGATWETEEDLEFDVHFPGYEQVVRYEIFPGDLVLPRTVTRYNDNGDVIMQLQFVEYDLGDLP